MNKSIKIMIIPLIIAYDFKRVSISRRENKTQSTTIYRKDEKTSCVVQLI